MTSVAPPASSRRYSGVIGYLRELWARRDFVWYLAMSNLRARDASTALGVLWWVLNPLLLTSVFFLVFGLILGGRRGNPEFLAYLMSGLFAFRYTQSIITRSSSSIITNSKLIMNIRFPRLLLPLSSVIESALGFLVSIVAFFAIIIPVTGAWPGWRLLIFVPVFLAHTVFSLGIGAIAARLAVPFRDLTNLLPYLLRIWLYLSPIIWTLDQIESSDLPDWAFNLLNLNPLYHILLLYRSALLGWAVDPVNVIGAVVSSLLFATIGIWVFRRFERRMVNYL